MKRTLKNKGAPVKVGGELKNIAPTGFNIE